MLWVGSSVGRFVRPQRLSHIKKSAALRLLAHDIADHPWAIIDETGVELNQVRAGIDFLMGRGGVHDASGRDDW